MQADGNLVLYDANGKAYFSSQTDGKGGVRATLEVANNLNRFYRKKKKFFFKSVYSELFNYWNVQE